MKFKTKKSIKDPLLVCPCVFFILLQINVVYSCRYSNSFPSLKMFSHVLEIFLILSGNTSMESSLSLLMANLSKVQKNMLVIDPFVGTGEFFISMTTMNSKFWGLSTKDIKIENQPKQVHVHVYYISLYECFVGSILVPCAYHQAYVMGTDINYLLLHAKG